MSCARVQNDRVLVIDDSTAIHLAFRAVLNAGPEQGRGAERPSFEIDAAHQGEEGVAMVHRARLQGRPYALAFVDMHMPPGWNGLTTIERLWSTDPDLHVVVCSGETDCDWLDVVGKLGHSDKLLVLGKPARPFELLQCATTLCSKWANTRLVRDHVERLEEEITTRTLGLEAANRQLRHLATHDALTGLANRVLLDDRLRQAIAHGDRDSRSFALLECDLDRFKNINDSLGHGAGDELLQEVARRLTAVVRSTDTVARVGGDEFVVIATPIGHSEDAALLAARVMDVLRAPVRIGAIDIHTSPSIGIAVYPDDGLCPKMLLARADAAMYAAKQHGRGVFRRYAPGMDVGTEYSVQLEGELHQAVKLGQFELCYQPKVDVRTGQVRSAEALIRWPHPTRGVISPGEFVPLAEDCGLLGTIGAWAMREACRQARAWQLAGLPPLRVSVKLSPSQFRDSALVEGIRRVLADTQLDPRHLEVELTESAVMSDPEKSIALLEQLSLMGVLVSVDDFGTVYSSMSYLRRLPIDKLKIDRVFIEEMLSRPEDASIVRAIISLGHNLHLKVVAEGVETRAQLDFLSSAGCDEYQGYLFSRPLQPQDFERLIRDSGHGAGSPEDEAARTHGKHEAYLRR
jgi:diguanylate cyclase (GGDEF)-like protein